jgi:hypothetical protein
MMNTLSNWELYENAPEDFHAEYAEYLDNQDHEVSQYEMAKSLMTTEAHNLFESVLREDGRGAGFVCFAVKMDRAFEYLRQRFPEVIFGLTTREEDRLEVVFTATYWELVAGHLCGTAA